MPNGSDHNAGYECDRNEGIGKTNPAHTGCSVELVKDVLLGALGQIKHPFDDILANWFAHADGKGEEGANAAAEPGDRGSGPAPSNPAKGCAQALENDGDPYDSTCDGSPSLNGKGSGAAKGKPCAGCVGSADNKNPKGQMPNGSDHNAGYECDRNEGIGKTNPAHTGCTPEIVEDAVLDAAEEIKHAFSDAPPNGQADDKSGQRDDKDDKETVASTGVGTVEINPASAVSSCPGGTVLKIDGLRSDGTFGPIAVTNFTSTSFSWSSSVNVSAVLVKAGTDVATNPGGTSGTASSAGKEISHVIFCISGSISELDETDGDAEDKDAPCADLAAMLAEVTPGFPADASCAQVAEQIVEVLTPAELADFVDGLTPAQLDQVLANLPPEEEAGEDDSLVEAEADEEDDRERGDETESEDVRGAAVANRTPAGGDEAATDEQRRRPTVFGVPLPFTGSAGLIFLLLVAVILLALGMATMRRSSSRGSRE